MRFAKWVPVINTILLVSLALVFVGYFDGSGDMNQTAQGIQVVFAGIFILLMANIVFAIGSSGFYEKAHSTTKIRAVACAHRKNGDAVIYGFVDNTNDFAVRVVKGFRTIKLNKHILTLPKPSSFDEICFAESYIVNKDVVPVETITCLDLKDFQ